MSKSSHLTFILFFIITKSFQVEEIICNFTYNTDDPLTGQPNGRKNIQYHQ